MNLNQLRYFCVLAETEHYTKAAEQLAITQPTLTHSIKGLEQELGIALFDKQGRNIRINQYGKFFYQQIQPLLKDIDKAKNDVQQLIDPSKGTIRLAFLHSLAQDFIPQIIRLFVQNEENKQIRFILDEGTTADIETGFLADNIDLAFTSYIENEEITSFPILTQDLYLATPFSHPLANRDEIDLIEAKDYPFILYNEKSGLRPIIDELFNKIDVQPHIAYELAKDETICGFVAAKLGIAIVPNIFGIKHFPIKLIKIKQPTYEWKIYLSYKHTKYMAPPVCKFKDFILEHYPPLADKHEGE